MKKLILLPIIALAVTSCAPTAGLASLAGFSVMSVEAIEAQKLTAEGKQNFIRELKEELKK